MKDDTQHVQINNAHTEEYTQVLKELVDYCPFCPGQMTHQKHPIEFEGKYWLVTKNSYNYQEAKYPYLLIHREHITNFNQITVEGWSELQEMYSKVIEKNNIKGGTILMRFGDPKATGATVVHLHAHLISADPDRENPNPIMARIG